MDPNSQPVTPGTDPSQPQVQPPVQAAPVQPQPGFVQPQATTGQMPTPNLQQPQPAQTFSPIQTPKAGGGSAKKLGLLIAGLLVVGALAFAGMKVLGGSKSEPEKAIDAFLSAAINKDCTGLFNRVSSDTLGSSTRSEVIERCEDTKNDSSGVFAALDDVDTSYSTKLKEQTETTATVTVTDASNRESDIDLVLEDGKWMIADF